MENPDRLRIKLLRSVADMDFLARAGNMEMVDIYIDQIRKDLDRIIELEKDMPND